MYWTVALRVICHMEHEAYSSNELHSSTEKTGIRKNNSTKYICPSQDFKL